MTGFGDVRDRLCPLTLSDLIQIASYHRGKSVQEGELLTEWRFQFPDAVRAMLFVEDMTTTHFPVWAAGRVMNMGGPPRAVFVRLTTTVRHLDEPAVIAVRLNPAWTNYWK